MVEALGDEADDDRYSGTSKVYWDSVDLGRGGGVSKAFEDCRLEVCKRVCIFGHTEVHCNTEVDVSKSSLIPSQGTSSLPSPDLPVGELLERIPERNTVMRIVASFPNTLEHKLLLSAVKEGAVFWKGRNEEPARQRDGDGQYTFDDKDPTPSTVSTHSIHPRDETGNEAVHGSGNDARSEENHIASKVFCSRVVRANQVGCTGDESRLADTFKKTSDDKLFPRTDETTSNHGDGPKNHHDAERFGAILLKKDGARDASDEVAEIEHPDANVEALADEVQLLFHARDFGISNLGRVNEERQQLEELYSRWLGR